MVSEIFSFSEKKLLNTEQAGGLENKSLAAVFEELRVKLPAH